MELITVPPAKLAAMMLHVNLFVAHNIRLLKFDRIAGRNIATK